MWKLNETNALAQQCSRCKNYEIAMVDQASNSHDYASFCPWFDETDAHKWLEKVDPTRIHTMDEELWWNWWKSVWKFWENLEVFGGKSS